MSPCTAWVRFVGIERTWSSSTRGSRISRIGTFASEARCGRQRRFSSRIVGLTGGRTKPKMPKSGRSRARRRKSDTNGRAFNGSRIGSLSRGDVESLVLVGGQSSLGADLDSRSNGGIERRGSTEHVLSTLRNARGRSDALQSKSLSLHSSSSRCITSPIRSTVVLGIRSGTIAHTQTPTSVLATILRDRAEARSECGYTNKTIDEEIEI